MVCSTVFATSRHTRQTYPLRREKRGSHGASASRDGLVVYRPILTEYESLVRLLKMKSGS
jgi:hypothetical protein